MALTSYTELGVPEADLSGAACVADDRVLGPDAIDQVVRVRRAGERRW